METQYYYNSPVGCLEITLTGNTLTGLRVARRVHPESDPQNPLARKVFTQLTEYFARQRRTFDLPVVLDGTPFQLGVWEQLKKIPYGTTISYQQLADATGDPNCLRSVGTANGKNPVAIVVPCHRVIRANGEIGGYAYGMTMKADLLDLEGAKWGATPSRLR
jgi:methylated-DNA-[protein]-cysteine S-methyltransferase